MLRTTLPACDDGSFRRVFKALLPFEKEEKKRVYILFIIPLLIFVFMFKLIKALFIPFTSVQVIEHIDKISTVRRCSYISAACDIFSAKISGTFKRSDFFVTIYVLGN